MSIKQAKHIIEATGCHAIWDSTYREWKITPPRGNKSSAYYTDDTKDAIDTARAMAR